jgi:hypothetical protein
MENEKIDPIAEIDILRIRYKELGEEIDELNKKQDAIQDDIHYDSDLYDEWAQLEREISTIERHRGSVGQKIIDIVSENQDDERIQRRLLEDAIRKQLLIEQFEENKRNAAKRNEMLREKLEQEKNEDEIE